jgi:signal transduction histidine kinase
MKMVAPHPARRRYVSGKREASQGVFLVLDEDKATRSLLKKTVQKLGFTCKTVKRADEALRSLRRQVFELMITDIDVEDMDGLELLREAKKYDSDLDIIMMTGMSADHRFSDLVVAGASDIIPKPVNPEEIEAKISRVVRERRLRKELEQKNLQLQKYLEDLQVAKDRLEEQASRMKVVFSEIEKANEVIEKQNQRILKANWELEKADRMKSNFLATVSHELRTPLNAVIGFLGLVLDDLCENRQEEKTLLRDALSSSKNLLFLINNMIDLAKIEAGKLDIFSEEFNLKDVLAEVTSLLSVQAREKGLYLRGQIGDLPPVYADKGKVWQVLNNLLGNAIKFTDTGGVDVRAHRHTEDLIEVEVKDTGTGVRKEEQRHIFERFFQADKNYKRKQMGSGLGLLISKNLVEMMGGTVRFTSSGEGKGSRVFFTLPMHKDCATLAGPPGDSCPVLPKESHSAT